VSRLALTLAFGAMIAAGLPSPGVYLAIGLAVASIGYGYVGFARREATGSSRLTSAAAITVGVLGLALGTVRVAMVLAAIGHIDHMLG
jgi:hypothetical protein